LHYFGANCHARPSPLFAKRESNHDKDVNFSWRTTKHENSQAGSKSFIFNTRSRLFSEQRVKQDLARGGCSPARFFMVSELPKAFAEWIMGSYF
jgi:hypothetical protein